MLYLKKIEWAWRYLLTNEHAKPVTNALGGHEEGVAVAEVANVRCSYA